MTRLSNQIALITGGGSGIGLATAAACLAEGAKVAITGRDAGKLQQAVDRLRGGDRLLSLPANVGSPEDVEQLVNQVQGRLGSIDILVNNAGSNIPGRSIRELSPAAWQTLVHNNLDSAYFCCHAVLPGMIGRGGGLIIFINSIAGKRATPISGAAYAASKFGMRALATALAAEEGKNGIRVTSIFPGEVDTPILELRPKALTAEQRQIILRPEDVAAAVVFVATLPARVSVPELLIKPTAHVYV